MPKHLATRLRSLCQTYEAELAQEGIKALPGYSLPTPDALAVMADLEYVRPRQVADLGCGFSTVLFRFWAAQAKHPCHVISTDHDREWLAALGRILERMKLTGRGELMEHTHFEGLKQPFGAVLLDHGPTMESRVVSVASIITPALLPGGIVWVDDFRGQYRKQVTQALRTSGFEVEPPADGRRMARAWRKL